MHAKHAVEIEERPGTGVGWSVGSLAGQRGANTDAAAAAAAAAYDWFSLDVPVTQRHEQRIDVGDGERQGARAPQKIGKKIFRAIFGQNSGIFRAKIT